MSGFPFPGPVPPESNPPITPQYYQPGVFNISNISLGINTTITTSVNHNYVIGQLVRLLVPYYYGTFQINGMEAYVIAIPAANEVTINIDSTLMNQFISNPSYGPTPPQIAAIGDVNTGPINTGRSNNQTYISGSFIDISPV